MELQKLTNWNYQNKFDKPFTAALVGATKSGKTTFLNYLIPKIYQNFDIILFFSVNSHADVYKPIKQLDNVICFNGFNEIPVKKLVQYNKLRKNEFSYLILIDDEVNNKNSPIIRNLFTVLRNSNFSTIYSGQDMTFINKANRNNLNYLFLFKQNNMDAYDNIHKTFFKNLIYKGNKEKRKFAINDIEKNFLINNTLDHNIIVLDILNDYSMHKFKVPI